MADPKDPKISDKGPQPPANTAQMTPAVRAGKRVYHLGLIEEAPFDVINVPTVVLQPGNVRGKCPQVCKKSARVEMGPGNILVHHESAIYGSFEELFDVEVEGFLKYIDTHVFRKTSEYTVDMPNEIGNPRAGTRPVKKWRADIEPLDPVLSGSIRALHDEASVTHETLASYVWIVEAKLDRRGKPMPGSGPQETVAAMRKAGTFKLDKVEVAKK